ncbi:MAG: hydrolase [Bacteroidetes bacterium RIFCSPLOWO2_12_FULL_35_15]|nr:MAG: hydrolase [Bacteroidetes bacterium RIFCSPLOWO2_12_FULL_35_15]
MIVNQYNKLVNISIEDVNLEGQLTIPEHAESLVIFSHGSGSSRFSPRNNFVANILHENGIGTFLLDLLTKEEDEIYSNRFNIDLLSERLVIATKYLSTIKQASVLDFGYFGASTGAASALKAAAELHTLIHSVVSRGGRPDLAMDVLPLVKSPTLLIVGELDTTVLELNKKAFDKLQCTKKLKVIKGATHLFEEPGTLEMVAKIATEWFNKTLEPVRMQIH